MKYRSAYSLAETLGKWMALNWTQQDGVLVPVPLHPQREKMRGFNQARLLAEQLGLPAEMLKRIKNKHPQAELPREDRLKNLKNSFKISGKFDLSNKKIVLVDDVCSTGATLNECAKVLRQAGAKEIWGLVLARG